MAQGNAQQIETILKIDVDYQEAIKDIGSYLTEIKKLNDAQKELNKEFKAGTITEEQYGQATAANKAATTQLKTEMKALSTEVKKKLEADRAAVKQIDINNASYNKLAATYKQMKMRINEMSAAERAQNKQYIDQSKQVYERMKTLQAETGKMQLNVGNYQQAITQAITGNSRFAQSLMGMTSGASGISGAFGMIGNAAKALGQSLMTLMANPVFLAIAGVAGVGMAFKFWKDYNDGLAEASRLTTQFTGLVDDEMADVRDSIQATADVFGKDFKETLQGADVLVAQFGISWQEASDIINKGFAAGADLNGDMLQQIQQYGPALRDAGLGAEELVAVIQQTRSGVFGKDGMDVITKAGKNLRDMSATTAKALQGIGINADELKRKLADGSITMMEAIQQVSGSLKNVSENSQEAGAVIDNVFGKKGVAAGQAQLKAIEDLNMSLDSLVESEGEYGKVQMELVETQEELNKYTAALFGMDGWDVMKKKIELLVKKGLVYVLKAIVEAINYCIDWYNESMLVRGAVNAIVTTVKNSWAIVKLVFNLIIDAVKSLGRGLRSLGNIIEGVFTFDWDKVTNGYDQLVNGFKDTWSEVALDAKNFGSEVADNVAEGFNSTMNSHLDKIDISAFTEGMDGGSAAAAPAASSSSGGSKGGSGKTGKSGNSKSDKEAEKTRKEEEKRIKEQQKLEEEQRKAAEKAEQLRRKAEEQEMALRQRLIQSRLDIVKKGTEEELNLKLQALDAELEAAKNKLKYEEMEEATRQELLLNMEKQYQQKRQDLITQAAEAERQRMEQATANDFTKRIMAAANNELEQERIKLEQLNQLRDDAHRKDGESEEAFIARKLQLEQDYLTAKENLAKKEIEIEQAKYEAIGQLSGAIGEMFETLGEKNRDALIVSKVLAIAEVAIQQGIAIANAVRAAAEGSHTVWTLVAQIAVGIATVTASITQAISAINSAKFAKGGLVTGPGTGTSDSVPAQLSNGESVMTASATALFSPLLSALNQLGGGVPIVHSGMQAQLGEDMLASAIAKGYAMAPAPVVSVKEITDVENRVMVIEDMARS